MILLKEINALRTELKRNQTQAHDLEATLKLARKHGFSEQAINDTSSVTYGRPQDKLVGVNSQDESRVVEMQTEEIKRLRAKIKEMSSAGSGRDRSSGGYLPPVLQPPEHEGIVL